MARRLALQIDLEDRAPTEARAALNALAGDLEPDLLSDLRLVITELVANSVRHSGVQTGTVEITVRTVRPSQVRAEVADPGPGFKAVVSAPDPTRSFGLGLYIVDKLSNRWGVRDDGPSRVWFELRRDASPGAA